ncbi:unnamed protein product, partial [Mesorhabditis spiculigera]
MRRRTTTAELSSRGKPTTRICEAHVFRCLAVDFNPNLPNLLATGGDEGALRIWDLRQPKAAIFCTRPHSHWVTQVRYHQVHDQLLLTGSSDACVVLNCAQSVSSDAQIDASAERDDDGEPLAKLTDGELDRINEHEDTVSAVEWSSADPWIYASLSYDGRVVINRVAHALKKGAVVVAGVFIGAAVVNSVFQPMKGYEEELSAKKALLLEKYRQRHEMRIRNGYVPMIDAER